ncbi:MAG: hypothetical protein HY556_04075 [Euryarchaeota archaeon]|nr:hypothetical protein [Euryarchaeota archaeon]
MPRTTESRGRIGISRPPSCSNCEHFDEGAIWCGIGQDAEAAHFLMDEARAEIARAERRLDVIASHLPDRRLAMARDDLHSLAHRLRDMHDDIRRAWEGSGAGKAP